MNLENSQLIQIRYKKTAGSARTLRYRSTLVIIVKSATQVCLLIKYAIDVSKKWVMKYRPGKSLKES